jgi:hypothetical protein
MPVAQDIGHGDHRTAPSCRGPASSVGRRGPVRHAAAHPVDGGRTVLTGLALLAGPPRSEAALKRGELVVAVRLAVCTPCTPPVHQPPTPQRPPGPGPRTSCTPRGLREASMASSTSGPHVEPLPVGGLPGPGSATCSPQPVAGRTVIHGYSQATGERRSGSVYLEADDISEALRYAAEAVRERELPLRPVG